MRSCVCYAATYRAVEKSSSDLKRTGLSRLQWAIHGSRGHRENDKPFGQRGAHFFGFSRFSIELICLVSRGCRSADMKNPGFNPKRIWLLCAAFASLAVTVFAEAPDLVPKKAPARSRPQIIYHLPPASNSAATLHSQAKGRNNDLPVDSSMPTSLQMSHARANEAAAAAEQQQTPVPSPPPPPVTTRVESNSLRGRPRSSPKSQGHRHAHGHKSGKS